MPKWIAKSSLLLAIAGAALLSACEKQARDEAMGQIISDCQMNAHGELETSNLEGEQKHFALGEIVEKCLRQGGLLPVSAEDDPACFERPPAGVEAKGFIKPTQKCWKHGQAR